MTEFNKIPKKNQIFVGEYKDFSMTIKCAPDIYFTLSDWSKSYAEHTKRMIDDLSTNLKEMETTNMTNAPLTIEELTNEWVYYKEKEREANAARLLVEQKIIEVAKPKEKGTTTLDTGLKIVTGFTEKWDQQHLYDVYSSLDEEGRQQFPFDIQFKPSKASQFDNRYWEYISDALTVYPSKPSFSYKPREEA